MNSNVNVISKIDNKLNNKMLFGNESTLVNKMVRFVIIKCAVCLFVVSYFLSKTENIVCCRPFTLLQVTGDSTQRAKSNADFAATFSRSERRGLGLSSREKLENLLRDPSYMGTDCEARKDKDGKSLCNLL